jgi:hypothetical protein
MRVHKCCVGILAAFLFATTAEAAVIILVRSAPATGLPGFTTHTLTATSDVSGELIHAVDFVGDGNNDPATGKGFFGPMYQHTFPLPAIFKPDGIPPLIPDLFPSRDDSQFLVGSTTVVVPPGLAEEGPNLLQAAWAWSTPIGQSFELAQIVVSNASTTPVTYRGTFAVTRNGFIVDTPEVTGMLPLVPEPTSNLPLVALVTGVLSLRSRRRPIP